MSAYVVVNVEPQDVEGYREYQQLVPGTLAAFGGRFIVRGGKLEQLEGTGGPKRLVILEFPSAEQVKAWYQSPEYQAIIPLRTRTATTHFLSVVEGV